MANTQKIKKQVENWYRKHLEKEYSTEYYKITQEKVSLIWGGKFEYDAVVRLKSDSSLISVYCLSCSEYLTNSNKPGTGKFNKLKADVLMMVATDCPIKVMAFTSRSMHDRFHKEKSNGRIPKDIILKFVDLEKENIKLLQLVQTIYLESSTEND